jgi:hypothetical protein
MQPALLLLLGLGIPCSQQQTACVFASSCVWHRWLLALTDRAGGKSHSRQRDPAAAPAITQRLGLVGDINWCACALSEDLQAA